MNQKAEPKPRKPRVKRKIMLQSKPFDAGDSTEYTDSAETETVEEAWDLAKTQPPAQFRIISIIAVFETAEEVKKSIVVKKP